MVMNKIRTRAHSTKHAGEVGWFAEEDAQQYPVRGKSIRTMAPSHVAATGKQDS